MENHQKSEKPQADLLKLIKKLRKMGAISISVEGVRVDFSAAAQEKPILPLGEAETVPPPPKPTFEEMLLWSSTPSLSEGLNG